MDQLARAEEVYQAAIFAGDTEPVAGTLEQLTGTGPDIELMRGRLRHCLNLPHRTTDAEELGSFERAASDYGRADDDRGLAQALFWQGCYHQVLAGDDDTAVPLLERSLDLARRTDDTITASYALRHLGIAHQRRNELDVAEQRLTESTALRRAAGFGAGVAANLVGLAHLSLARNDREQAERHAQEALELATASGAAVVLGHARDALAAAQA